MDARSVVPQKPDAARRRFGPARGLAVGLVVLIALLRPDAGFAQTNSLVDTIYVDTTFVPAGQFDFGDTVWVGVGLANTFDVAAMVYRLELDTALMTPFYDLDTISGAYNVMARLINRGIAFDKPAALKQAVIPHPETTSVIRGALVDFEGTAFIPQGTGTILELAFMAKSGIVAGDTTVIAAKDNLPQFLEPRNNISDVTGTVAVFPRLRESAVLWGQSDTTSGPGNDPPIITLTPPTQAYTIKQGQTVAFAVNANDPDTTNDQVTISAGLPAGAVWLPTNPVVGIDSVDASFEWTPNFSQEGLFIVTISAADDKGGVRNTSVSITVEKQEIDILFTTSADNDAPVGGIRGKPGVLIPIDVLASRAIYGVQFDLVLDGAAFVVDSIVPTSKLTNFTLFDNVGLNPDTTRVITFSVSGDSIPLGSGTTLMNVAVTIDTGAAPGRYPITFLNALEAVSPDPDIGSIDMVVQNGAMFVDRLGDVNLNLKLDVGDMVGLTSHILTRDTLSPRQFDVADVNADSFADVVDLVAIINATLGFDTLALPTRPVYDGGEAELRLSYQGQSGDQALYVVEGYMPTDVAGMELTFRYDPDKLGPYRPQRTGKAANLTVLDVRESGLMKIVAYYNANPDNVVRPGHGSYFLLPVQVLEPWPDANQPPLELVDARLSDPAAAKVRVKGIDAEEPVVPLAFELHQNYPNPFNPSTTIRFVIGETGNPEVRLDIYNVLGQHVRRLIDDRLAPGTYDARWDGHDKFGGQVASGLYLYRLSVDKAVQTRKMVLLK